MLILTQRPNESVTIGDDIVVKVIGIKGGQVRIGIEAPKEVTVHREELVDKIKLEESHKGNVAPAVQVRVKEREAPTTALNIFETPATSVSTESAVWNVSKWDESKWSSQDGKFQVMLASLNT